MTLFFQLDPQTRTARRLAQLQARGRTAEADTIQRRLK